MKLRLKPRAIADLEEIADYLSEFDPLAAERVLDAIEHRCRQLADQPRSGVLRDDIAPGIRHLLAGNYLIFYVIASDAVEIVRILHGRRKIEPPSLG